MDQIKIAVKRARDQTVVDRGGGVRTFAVVTKDLGATQFLSGVTEFVPGASIPLHSHNCEESVVILDGIAALELQGGERFELEPGDATWILAGSTHRIANIGRDVLRILWIYGRVDATRTLASTGKTYPIGSEPPQGVPTISSQPA
jgi:quercetin dioxygenase-like cupin family protein